MERPLERAARTLREARARYLRIRFMLALFLAGMVATGGLATLSWLAGNEGAAWNYLALMAVFMATYAFALSDFPDAHRRYLDAARIYAARSAIEAAARLDETRSTETSWPEVTDLLRVLREGAREHPQVEGMLRRIEPGVEEYRRGRWSRSELAAHVREHAECLLEGRPFPEVQEKKW